MKLLHKITSLLLPIGMMLMIYYRDVPDLLVCDLALCFIILGSLSLYKGFNSIRNNSFYLVSIGGLWGLFLTITCDYIETYFNPLAIICAICIWCVISLLNKSSNIGKFIVTNSLAYLLFFVLFKLMELC